MPRIGILGPGAIGGLIAALASKNCFDVVCISLSQTLRSNKSVVLQVCSKYFGNFSTTVKFATQLECDLDLLVITTKSPYLERSLDLVSESQFTIKKAVTLLNGIGHDTIIRAALGNCLAVGTIGSIQVTSSGKHCILQNTYQEPQIEIASDTDLATKDIEDILKTFQCIGINTINLESESSVIWRKLVRLGAIATITAAFQQTIGQLSSESKTSHILQQLIKEGIKVASSHGVVFEYKTVMDEISRLPETLTTSLQRDIGNGVNSEVDSITGGIIRIADDKQIDVPFYKKTYNMIIKLTI